MKTFMTTLLLTTPLLMAFVTASAQAMTKAQAIETLKATIMLSRAEELCPQYSFSYTKTADTDGS